MLLYVEAALRLVQSSRLSLDLVATSRDFLLTMFTEFSIEVVVILGQDLSDLT